MTTMTVAGAATTKPAPETPRADLVTGSLGELPAVIVAELAAYFAEENGYGAPVGFVALTEFTGTCHEGCLAPGSSPHSHSIVTAWRLIGTRGYVDVATGGKHAGKAVRSGMIHPFPID